MEHHNETELLRSSVLRHRYTENYQDIPFSEISQKLNAYTLLYILGIPPCPASKLKHLGTRLVQTGALTTRHK